MNGIIIVNKKSGMSSSRVVQRIKTLSKEKCGHLGTLDPLAEGVLPVAVGRATRLFDFFLNKTKTYVAVIRFGYQTDTLDNEGKIVYKSNALPTLDQIKKVIAENLIGEISQLPPEYSAKKIDGRRSYDLARSGQGVVLTPSKVNVYSFDIIREIDSSTFEAKIVCSSGTYIRSLCRDVGLLCGTYATMHHLCRISCGDFDLTHSVELDKLDNDNVNSYIIPLEKVLCNLPKAHLEPKEYKDLLDGKKINKNELNFAKNDVFDEKNEVFATYLNEKVVGLGKFENDYFKIVTHLV